MINLNYNYYWDDYFQISFSYEGFEFWYTVHKVGRLSSMYLSAEECKSISEAEWPNLIIV
jgi:hypothetical protein